MNIHITARTFTSGSDIIRSAAALNARLHRPAREFVCVRRSVKVPEPEPEPQPEPEPTVIDERQDADWHIRSYAYWRARASDGNAWQHVVDRCMLWGIRVADVKQRNQAAYISGPRAQLAWELAFYIIPNASLGKVGSVLGRRDHSTIQQIISRHEKRMGT